MSTRINTNHISFFGFFYRDGSQDPSLIYAKSAVRRLFMYNGIII